MTTTADEIDYTYPLEICDSCLTFGPVTCWLPERYAADNYCPSSFSLDELIAVCPDCRVAANMTHDPAQPRLPLPGYKSRASR